MDRHILFRIVISVIAAVNIVGILVLYGARNLSFTQESWTAEESSVYVSTSYTVSEAEDVDDNTEEDENGESGRTAGETDSDVAANEEASARDSSIYPTLELTTDSITLRLGQQFNYLNYLKTYQDVDGSDLSRVIRLDGSVNTNQIGDYAVTYSVTSAVTGQTTSVTLEVHVQ